MDEAWIKADPDFWKPKKAAPETAAAKPGPRLMPAMGRSEFRQWRRQHAIKALPRIRPMPRRQTIGAFNTPRSWPESLVDGAWIAGAQGVPPFDS